MPDDSVTVLDRYEVNGCSSGAALLGAGSFSITWRALDKHTKTLVALKTYKYIEDKAEYEEMLLKFKHQVEILQKLEKDLSQGELCWGQEQETYWSKHLESLNSKQVFLQLVDYSKNWFRQPHPHDDGACYVILEMGEYSLKDFLVQRREENDPLDPHEVQSIARSIVEAVAAFHSKRLVHLDLKPENIMFVDGHWKLIDVDGAMEFTSVATVEDSGIAFSPAYCSPEFAQFALGDDESTSITINPATDVWSVGLTLAELVLKTSVIHQQNVKLLQGQNFNTPQGVIEWLAFDCPHRKLPLPSALTEFDADFARMIGSMLVRSADDRVVLAKVLGDKYWKQNFEVDPKRKQLKLERGNSMSGKAPKNGDSLTPVFKGVLWKLNADGDVQNADDWRKRDFWLTAKGEVCYYSSKEKTALIMLDKATLQRVNVIKLGSDKSAFPHTFAMVIPITKETACFAAETEKEVEDWMRTIQEHRTSSRNSIDMKKLKELRLTVRNARKHYDQDAQEYQKKFSGNLWKLVTDGSPTEEKGWRLREMWLAENGSFCYYSEKQKTQLAYHTAEDLKSAKICRFRSESCKPWAFEIRLPPKNGIEYEPGIFAAPSQRECNDWVQKLKELTLNKKGYAARRVSNLNVRGEGGYASQSAPAPASPTNS
eukprot:gnl/MRDRNA2_/MRDRNA2_218012_c0_seq1.p1 gnl/MRDRNA2_/MRDRNA2_218012_c0~~gnl/MRDRNA2_/MRDRNA2_218012_c0_seq1.p1  ORF type:complete len:655 (-),score=126.24 gnl/MRDRNA2_/MRDRNA2_218012_c0_seq1:19-1983(-)